MIKGIRGEKYIIQISLVICFFYIAPLWALDYPKGPVQIVVPFAPGGAVDIFWRTISETVNKNLNGSIAILNKPGGGGVVGTSAVVNSKPNGYTLLGGTSDPLNIAPVITPNIPYDVERDLTYIAKLVVFPQLIVVRAESPFKTLDDLITFAKNNPKRLKAGLYRHEYLLLRSGDA